MKPQRCVGCIIIAIIVVFSLFLAGRTSLAQSEAPVIFKVSPTEIRVLPGEVSQFAIEIENARELYAFELKLRYDPAVVEIIDENPHQEGVQVAQGAFFDSGFDIRNIADNEIGALHFAMTQLNPSEAKSGDGVALVIRIRGKTANATSSITITKATVAQRDGTKLPTESKDGMILVVAPGTPVPTATSIPTQAPGTPLPTATPTNTPSASTTVPTNTPTASAPTFTPTQIPPSATPTATPAPSDSTPPPTPTSAQPPGPTATPTFSPPPTSTSIASPPPTHSPTPPQETSTPTPLPTPAASAVASPVQKDDATPPPPTHPAPEEAPSASRPNTSLLILGVGLLALAGVLGLAAYFIWRRSTN